MVSQSQDADSNGYKLNKDDVRYANVNTTDCNKENSLMIELVGQLKLTGNLQENWKRWFQKFTNYLIASEKHKKPDLVKTAMLLHLIGDEGLDIYNSFKWNSNDDKNNFQIVVEKFNHCFTSKKNILYERCRFFKCRRKKEQSLESYLNELKCIAAFCEFDNQEENLIRDRLVLSIEDENLREAIFSEDIVSLNRVIEYLHRVDTFKEQFNSMQQNIQISQVYRLIKEEHTESETNSQAYSKNEEVMLENDYVIDESTDHDSSPVYYATDFDGTRAALNVASNSKTSNLINAEVLNCQYCKFKTNERDALKEHMLKEHNKKNDNGGDILFHTFESDTAAVVADDNNDLICKLCDYQALSRHMLRVHMRIHNTKRPFGCNICDCRFISHNSLRRHMIKDHSDPGFSCSECPYVAKTKPTLDKHFAERHVNNVTSSMNATENNDTNVAVKPRKFKKSRKHMFTRKRVKDKPHKCTRCPYSASQRSTLRKHIMRLHTGERPYACDHCSYSTVTSYHLKRHVNNVHAVKQYDDYNVQPYDHNEEVVFGDLDITQFLNVHLAENAMQFEN